MKRIGFTILRIVLAGSVFSTVGFTQTTNVNPSVVWERQFGDQKLPYTQVAIASLPKRSGVTLCVPSSGGGGPKTFAQWRMSSEGQILKRSKISSTAGEKLEGMTATSKPCLCGLEDGHLMIVVKSDSGRTLLLDQDEQGTISLAKDLALLVSVIITRIVRDSVNNFLLVGYLDKDAFAMKIDPHGNELWRGTFDHGSSERFTSAIPCVDGGCVLIGFSSTSKGIPDPKVSEVWLLRCDGNGIKQSEKAFCGSLPDACATDNGAFAIVYYKAGVSDTGLWLEEMTDSLKSKWSKKVCSVEYPVVPFRIVSAAGGFVVAGTRALRFWMAGLNGEAKELWSFQDTRDESYSLLCLDITNSAEGVFVLTSTMSPQQNQDTIYKFGLLKVSLKF